MSAERDETRIVRSWLEDGVTALPDRVLDAVLDQLPATPQRRATWWPVRRNRSMTSSMRLVTAAVAVAGIIAIGSYAMLNAPFVSPGTDGSPTASPSPSAMVTRQLYRSAPFRMEAGPYAVDSKFEAPFTLNVPKDWTGLEHKSGFALLIKTWHAGQFGRVPNLALLGLYRITGAFADPCVDEAPLDPAPQGIDGFVAALRREVGVNAGPMTDTTVGGLPAKTFDITTTIDYESCPNQPASLWTFNDVGTHTYHENNTGGQSSRIWLVDVNGTLILINAELTEQGTDADRDELYRMVDSIQFE
jgi:hypothetical protein